MNYTNGFDVDLVLPALRKRLGWRQPTVIGSPVLNSDNLASTSGRYFGDDFHALCSIENIKASQPDPLISDADFNTYLYQKQDGMIMRALNEVFRMPELLEQCLMYTRFGLNDLILPNVDQWVGWVIEIANDPAISTQITFGTFYFDADVTFNIYLFQDGIREPLQTIPVTVEAYAHTVVDFDSLVLPFKTGQRYYFAYDQRELGEAHAIREQVESLATTLCFEAYNFQAYRTDDGTYFNHNNKQYPALPAGVNLEIISFRDHTQKILRKANLFDEIQGLQMAAFAMEAVNNSTRSNGEQRQSQQQSQQAYMDLNQAFPTKEVPITPGLKSRIIGEFKRLKNTFFPPPTPVSMSMEQCGDLDTYESNWIAQNKRVFKNPGVYVSS